MRKVRVQFFILCMIASSLVGASDPALDEMVSFDVPSQRADLALIEFAEQANRTLLFSYDIASQANSNPLQGDYSIWEGLQHLLDGTGLAIHMGDDGQLSVVDQLAGNDSGPGLDTASPALPVNTPASDSPPEDPGVSPDSQWGVNSEFGNYLETVLVTARKREEPLQELPTSAAVLGRGLLGDMGVLQDLRSLTDLVAGITINDTNLAFITEPSIRGAGGGRNRMSVSATGLYRNGAYFATGGLGGKNFARMDNYDLERAEILRGPQGALYGRNALGGSINLITRKPQDEFYYDITLRTGDLDLRGVEAKLNLPLSESFSMRLSHVSEERDDGFWADVNSKPLDRLDYRHSRLSLRYHPSENVDVNYVYDTQDQILPPGIRIRHSLLPQLNSEFNTFANTPHRMAWDVDNHQLSIDWNSSGGTFTSVTNLRDRFVSARQDGDFWISGPPLQSREFLQQSDVGNILFQEIRYVSDGSGRFNWLAGVDYFSSVNNDLIDLTLGETWPAAQIRNTRLEQASWAAFASMDYTLASSPVTFSLEARYAVDDIDGSLLLYRFRDLSVPERDFVVKDSYTNVPWSGTVSYKLAEQDALLYFKLASSYRQGGMNDGPGHPDALFDAKLSYGEESSLTYELGWKSSALENRLTFNAAGYYIFYDDFIAGTDNGCPAQCQLLDGDGNPLGFNPDGSRVGEDENGEPIPPFEEIPRTAFLDNVGDAEAWGVEAELSFLQPFERSGSSLMLNFGWSRQMGSVQRLNQDVAEALRVRALNARLQFMRPKQYKAQAVFRKSLKGLAAKKSFSNARFVATLNVVHEENGFWDLNRSNPNPMDTARRVNARIGIQTDRWSLMLNGKNLTDEDYHLWSDAARTHYRRIDPRFFFAEFTYRHL